MKTLTKAAIIGGAVFVSDAFIFNQGLLAAGLVIIAVFKLFGHALSYLTGKNRKAFSMQHVAAFSLYFAAGLGVFVVNRVNNQAAHHTAQYLIQKIEQYKADKGDYPAHLADLVPNYLTHVPKAKWALMFNDYVYLGNQNRHVLMYAAFPPFSRKAYDFEGKQWKMVD